MAKQTSKVKSQNVNKITPPRTSKELKEPVLTIIMPLYNKGQYIKDALDSILMQETTYKYQILISDNASTDDSLKIAKEYQEKYADLIVILESKQNVGFPKNITKLYTSIKTPYFALVCPDDYWISNTKIQDALDFLESHKDYTSYQDKTIIEYPDRKQIYVDYPIDHTCDFQSFSKGRGATMGHASNSFFRTSLLKNHINNIKNPKNEAFEKVFSGDSFMNFIALYEGKAYHGTKIGSVFRHHGEGEWSSLGQVGQNFDNTFLWRYMWEYFNGEYMIFLLVSCQLYISHKDKLIEYLHSIQDDKILRAKVNEFKELESLYNINMQKLVEFQNSLQANA